jgi:hypothetical protein
VVGLLPWVADHLLNRRRVSVLVHKGSWLPRSESHYFVKVTNLSSKRDVEITHVWFEGDPPVYTVGTYRPLPQRLRPDETWEGWVKAIDLAHATEIERSARVRVTGKRKVVESRRNEDVPPVGNVAGSGAS